MNSGPFTFRSLGPGETFGFGEALGKEALGGEIFALYGELGGGKTLFTQGLARGLGVPEEEYVTSPTFTILNIHGGRLTLYHFDLFRISDPAELFELGMDEYLYSRGVSVVEWADRMKGEIPPERLDLGFAFAGPDERLITVKSVGKGPERLFERAVQILKESGRELTWR